LHSFIHSRHSALTLQDSSDTSHEDHSEHRAGAKPRRSGTTRGGRSSGGGSSRQRRRRPALAAGRDGFAGAGRARCGGVIADRVGRRNDRRGWRSHGRRVRGVAGRCVRRLGRGLHGVGRDHGGLNGVGRLRSLERVGRRLLGLLGGVSRGRRLLGLSRVGRRGLLWLLSRVRRRRLLRLLDWVSRRGRGLLGLLSRVGGHGDRGRSSSVAGGARKSHVMGRGSGLVVRGRRGEHEREREEEDGSETHLICLFVLGRVVQERVMGWRSESCLSEDERLWWGKRKTERTERGGGGRRKKGGGGWVRQFVVCGPHHPIPASLHQPATPAGRTQTRTTAGMKPSLSLRQRSCMPACFSLNPPPRGGAGDPTSPIKLAGECMQLRRHIHTGDIANYLECSRQFL